MTSAKKTKTYGESGCWLEKGWYTKSQLKALIEALEKLEAANRKSMEELPRAPTTE